MLIVLLAFLLRLYRLDHQSLWYDEGFSVYLARMSLSEITARTASDIHPPLYYYLLHLWLGPFGDSEFVLRFFSVVFGLLTVPLIYALGRRLLSTASGLLAALLLAFSPFYLWYSQEARMYTLVTFLCLLSSYLLLRALGGERKARFLWGGYIFVNILAVYSHFYAFFVLAFQAFFLLVWWGVNRKGDRLLAGLLSQGSVVVAYLPWSGFVLRRYAADVSYWRGELVFTEVVRKTLILFSTGHTILESRAQPIAFLYGALILFGLVIIALYRSSLPAREWSPFLRALFLTLYLFVPLLLLFLISYQRPKFHPRYLMLASPAFFLILAGGLAGLLERGKSWRWLPFSLGLASVSFLIVTSAYSDFNTYFDVRFTKDDFRSAARYIQTHIQDNEVVILTSGHLFPVFTYYYDRDDWYPIPDEPTLSAERVLNYSVADDLNRIVAGKGGVWLLLWQDEVVDPNGFLTMMLEEEGELLPFEGGFWGLKLYHYALPTDARFSSQPRIEYPVSVDFGDEIRLLGYSLPRKWANRKVEVTLYWQGLKALTEDYKISLRLRDEEGHYCGRVDARPASYWYPTMRWPPGENLFGKHTIETLPGTPPGEYQLELGVYTEEDPRGLDVLDEKGMPLGKSQIIGTAEVPTSEAITSFDQVEGEIERPLQAAFDSLELLGYNWEEKPVQAGDTITFTLFWRALSDVARDYSFVLQLIDAQGRLIESGLIYHLGTEAYPTSRWRPGEVIRGQYNYIIPAWPLQPSPGKAEIRVTLLDPTGVIWSTARLFSLEVQETERIFEPPSPQYALPEGSLGGLVSLLGYDLTADSVRPGDSFKVVLYWQALAPIDKSYTVFAHLLDSGNQVRAQKDTLPRGGARPTTGWVPGEFIIDEYELVVEVDAPPGEYILEAGMYDASTGERLLALDTEGRVLDNRLVLPTKIQVVAP
ncbi:MAG: glycosyltransferase family 39 protein [Anaerolineae bacterium]|nr:glycosyltransferase family 39 protein [Anaerolineae bacterium]